MKSTFKLAMVTAIAVFVASCSLNDKPEFNDDYAFAAFESTSYTVNEDAGTITIPVTIASVTPKKTTVTYSVTDGTAQYGVNYKLEDESGVLTFDGETRTMYIVIDITEVNDNNYESLGYNSSYTGSLTFTVDLVSAGSLNLGLESSCTVSISDLNHPLASIVGSYTATADVRQYGSGYSWTLTMFTDDDDDSIIWIDLLDPYFYGYGSSAYVYGTVSEDKTSITIDTPFTLGLYTTSYNDDGDYIKIVPLDLAADDFVTSASSITFSYDESTGTWESDNGIGSVITDIDYYGDGVPYILYYNYMYSTIKLVKN